LTAATLIDASFSVDAATGYPADGALEGNISLTESSGTGICWSAEITDGPSLVESVVINSVQDETLVNTLSEVDVLVDGELCGQLPTETLDNTEYTVTCPIPLNGTNIQLCSTKGDH